MDQLKQHFEKGILAVAMLVMGYVAFTLYMDADEVQTKIQEQKGERERGGNKAELGKIDMKPYTGALAKLEDTKQKIQEQFAGVPEDEVHKITWENGARMYGIE